MAVNRKMVPFPALDNQWVMIGFFFLVLFLPYLLGEKTAKVPVIGWIARKFQAALSRNQASSSSPLTIADLHDFVGEVVDERVCKIREEVEILADYVAYDARWHRRFDIQAGHEGFVPNPPEHMTLTEWLKKEGRNMPM